MNFHCIFYIITRCIIERNDGSNTYTHYDVGARGKNERKRLEKKIVKKHVDLQQLKDQSHIHTYQYRRSRHSEHISKYLWRKICCYFSFHVNSHEYIFCVLFSHIFLFVRLQLLVQLPFRFFSFCCFAVCIWTFFCAYDNIFLPSPLLSNLNLKLL